MSAKASNPPCWWTPAPARCQCPGCAELGLCDHHRAAITSMASKGHVNTEVTGRAARDLARQCRECLRENA